MDKKRLQASLKLIQLLLRCPSGEELTLLQSHASLVDSDFIQLMEQAANHLAAEGQQKTADFLRDVATQLRKAFAQATQVKMALSHQEGNEAVVEQPVALLVDSKQVKHHQLSVGAGTPEESEKDNRLQAYLQLIEALLKCPSGEEAQILYTNRDLLDAELVKMITQVAAALAERGNHISTDFLIYVAHQLMLILGLSPSTLSASSRLNSDSQTGLFSQELKTTSDNLNLHGSPQLTTTLDQRNNGWKNQGNNLTEGLPLKGNSLDGAEKLAKVMGRFSNLVKNFPLSNKTRNLELAIIGYQILITFLTRKASAELWANTQSQLGNAFLDRILEERDSLELAINCYHQALLVRTREAFPEDWAMLQNHLGNAYSIRIQGDRAENLELAINYFNQALRVYTHQSFSEQWATIQINLGSVYLSRLRGERAENIELAIHCYHQALLVYTPETFPEKWAMTQNSLGIAYKSRLYGEKTENLELAINYFNQALVVYTPEVLPEKWASTQSNLGEVYRKHLRGDKTENLELAINCFNQALKVYTQENFPEKWAGTQNNLGEVYKKRRCGERAENLELAIKSFHQALQIYTQENFPEKWAITQNNLGIAYSIRIYGDKTENLKLAISCFNRALLVRNPLRFSRKTGKEIKPNQSLC